MTLDDRERNFEKAMARELRADALNGLHCPDAETLAAYHERLLSPEEMAAQKSHIASCARCQEVLATLEVTESVTADAEQIEKVPALSAVKIGAMKAAPAAMLATNVEASRTSNVREIPKRKTFLKWTVPAGAIAAGLLVWVAIHQTTRHRTTGETYKPTEIAENRAQQEPPSLSAPKAESVSPALKVQGSAKADLDRKAATGEEADKVLADKLAQTAPSRSRAMNLPHGPSVLQNQVQNQIQNSGALAQNNSSTDYAVGGALLKSVPAPATPAQTRPEEQAKDAPAPAPPPAKQSADAAARKDEAAENYAITPSGANEASIAAKEKKVAAGETGRQKAAATSGVAAESAAFTAGLRDANANGTTLIRTTDPHVFWFVAADGGFFKNESGKQSVRQELGAGIKAIAASATDKKTCWVLAQGNLVLRTTDGGKHWEHVSPLSGANFLTITAADAQQAAVVDASGTVKLKTTDGGATWAVSQ